MLLGLYPFTRSQFFDNSGKPLTGGFIYAYASGSDTPATLFQDGYGLYPHEWPIVLDDAGSEKIYMAPIAYKIVIKNQFGELIEERDPVYSNGFAGGDSTSGSWVVVDNYNALRNLTTQVDAVLVLGRDIPNDGGSGIFIYDVDNTGIDDDGIVLVRSTTDRYVRQLNGYIEPAWFGAVYGQALDNGVALTNAIDGGIQYNLPVTISGSLYFNSNYSVKSGAKLNINGAIQSPAGISFTFKSESRLLSANQNAFSSNLKVIFEAGVADALNVSWFAGSIYQAITTSVYNYNLIVDKDVDITTSIETLANYSVDFIGGAKFIVKSSADIKINTLAYVGVGQIILYKDIAYIAGVLVGQSYCHLEWFGGVSSTSYNTDNSIAFKAALIHGKIYLISDATKFYNILSGTYSAPNGLVMLGNYVPNNSNINDLVPSTIRLASGANLTTTKMTLTALKIDGSGSITATESTLNDVMISNTVAYTTGLPKVNDSISISPNFTAVGTFGKIIRSNNADANWNPITTPINVNINSVVKGTKLYVLVGQNGLVETSPDSVTWTQRTSNVTANLNEVKWFSDVSKFVAVGESGKLIHSTDGISWNVVTTALTSIRSVARFSGKYVIVGGSGKIYTSPDLLTWTQKVVTGLTGTLYSVDASSSSLVIVGYNGTIVTSTDAINFTLRYSATLNTLLTVKYYSGTWVAGGTNGTLLSSKDGVSFNVINTYTGLTDSIHAQTQANGEIAFACGSGYVLTTFDLVKFNLIQPVNGKDIYGITNTESKIIAVGDSGVIAKSTDGINYIVSTIATENLNRIAVIGDTYYILGNNGKYLISVDGDTWTQKVITTSKNIYDIVSNSDNTLYTVVGSAGLVATSFDALKASPVWTIENIYSTGVVPLDTDLNDVVYNATSPTRKYITVGKNGKEYYSVDSHTWTLSSWGTQDLRMSYDGTTFWIVSEVTTGSYALYKSVDGLSFGFVETNNTKFSRVAQLGGSVVLFGFAGSSEIQVSTDLGTTWNYNVLNSNDYTITSVITAMISGNALVVYSTDNGKMLNGQLTTNVLTLTEGTINNSIVDIAIVNTVGGDVSNSTLLDIAFAGKVVDVNINKFTGSIGSLISRCNIRFDETMEVREDGFISDSSIVSISKDANTGVFNIANTSKSLGITNTIVNAPHGMLTYTEDSTIKININGGVIYNGNAVALSNGFAKVSTNGVFDENANIVKNITAYSIDGNCLEAELTSIRSNQTITSSKDRWYGTDLAKVDVDGDKFKVNAPIYIGGVVSGANTLRYRFGSSALRTMKNFGGRIKTTIKFPVGAEKIDQLASRVKAVLHIPSYTVDCYDYGVLKYRNGTNDIFTAGKVLAGSSSVDGATIINYTNVWSGREDLNQQLPVNIDQIYDAYQNNTVRDENNDYTFYPYIDRVLTPTPHVVPSNYLFGHDRTFRIPQGYDKTLDGDLTFEAYIVIMNESVAALPIGTTIKVELIPSLPKTIDTFNAYFEAPKTGVDSYNGREKQFLQFRDFSTGDLKVAFRMSNLSETWDAVDYTTAPNYYYNFTPGSGLIGQFAATYQPSEKLFQINENVRIDIENMFWTGAQTVPVYHYRGFWETDYYNAMQKFT